MGYESKLYIIEKPSHPMILNDDNKIFTRPIMMFDMCKYPQMSDVLRKQPKTDCYFYMDDGNTPVLYDKYDDELTEVSIEFLIELLDNFILNGEDYRRVFPLLSTLKSFKEEQDKGRWKNLYVLHFGH